MGFQVLMHKKAKSKLDKLKDSSLKERLSEAFNLISDPFSMDTVKIHGEEHTYRTRIGKYRVLCIIKGGTVYIVDFDTRGKIYK